MPWTEEEIDELLTSYLDQKLSSDDAARVERLLVERPDLEQKLAAWRANQQALRAIPAPKALRPDFAARVLSAARHRVTEFNDPNLAPWIPRNNPAAPIIEPAGKIRERDADEEANRASTMRRWYIAALAIASAACLFFAATWLTPSPTEPQFATNKSLQTRDTPSSPTDNSVIVLDDKPSSQTPNEPIEKPNVPPVNDDKPLVAKNARRDSNDLRSPEPAVTLPLPNSLADKSSTTDRTPPPTPSRNDRVLESTVGPSLQPTPEQLRMLEAMSPTAPGAFVMVIDVSLPPGVTGLDSLQLVLNRHDIPWSSQIGINDETRTSLVESRMISEAVKQGYLPDDARKETGDASKIKTGESVSLVFVKGRGSRLDQALIELMRRIEEFPEFSFDLAFDPPIKSLVDELRFVQEASLATPTAITQEAAGAVRVKTETEAGPWGSVFSAAPRRTPAMQHDIRKQSAELGTASLMNPIAYALIIVRHAKSE